MTIVVYYEPSAYAAGSVLQGRPWFRESAWGCSKGINRYPTVEEVENVEFRPISSATIAGEGKAGAVNRRPGGRTQGKPGGFSPGTVNL
jgi:hypothetical protein